MAAPVARWILAVDAAASMLGERAAILPNKARKRLLAKADGLGLRPFDANLVIAVVQDAQREGRALSRETQERLMLVRPADPGRVASPGSRSRTSLTTVGKGRWPRPGTVQTSVQENGFICLTVPSAMRTSGSRDSSIRSMGPI